MAKDWFRKTSWSDADQADFFDRLKRSRIASNKAQYLRIQAWYLEGVGSPELLRAALMLLDKRLAEFPETFELAQTYDQKASCLAKLGEIDKALDCCRLALETERKFPNMRTRAYLQFGRLVAENKLARFFDDALAVLEEMKPRGIEFPSDIYESFGICALIAAEKGEMEKAAEFAEVALNAAAKTHSGLRYHPTVGLVQDTNSRFYRSIEATAENSAKKF
jgi:tetratricopeptide (TPR) repeat protein